MAPPPSSPSGTPKHIFWLFLDPVNSEAICNNIELSHRDWVRMTMNTFKKEKLSLEMQEWFEFNPKLSTLKLWSPNRSLQLKDIDSEWVADHAPNFDPTGIATLFSKTALPISNFFGVGEPPEEPPKGLVHFIVTARRQEYQEERPREEEHDTLPNLVAEMRENYDILIEGQGLPSPSTAAKYGQHAKLQAKSVTAIYDGFYDILHPIDTSALPIEVYHPVFQQFMEDMTTVEPSEERFIQVQQLMRKLTGVGTIEQPLAKNLRAALGVILGREVQQVVVSGAVSDGVVKKSLGNCSPPLLVMEYKRGVGEGGCDPMVQASYSVLKYWQDNLLEETRNKCCCPTLIIAGSGPYLSVLGAIITDKFIVQQLTSGLVWLGLARSFEENSIYRNAQMFEALRRAVGRIDTFYEEVDKQSLGLVDRKLHSQFYPCTTKFIPSGSETTQEFEYIMPLTASTRSPFLVKLKPSGDKAVVKFVARYGVDAHKLLAAAGKAPRLLFCGSIDGQQDMENLDTKHKFGLHLQPTRMVVMEYIEGTQGEALTVKPLDTYTQVKEMVDELHKEGYVFGDLRPPNVVFRKNEAFLVDFDWAGKHGEAFYPTELGECITKHCGGRDLKRIEKEDDRALLDHYFRQ